MPRSVTQLRYGAKFVGRRSLAVLTLISPRVGAAPFRFHYDYYQGGRLPDGLSIDPGGAIPPTIPTEVVRRFSRNMRIWPRSP